VTRPGQCHRSTAGGRRESRRQDRENLIAPRVRRSRIPMGRNPVVEWSAGRRCLPQQQQPTFKETPMNSHDTHDIVSRARRSKVVAALAAVGLALAVAGSASAAPNTGSQTPAKKGCSIQLQGPGAGQSIVYAHGYKFSVYGENDKKTHTYTCNDGKWEETVTLTAGGTRWGNFRIVGTAGALEAISFR
jgi:hypothetical protein